MAISRVGSETLHQVQLGEESSVFAHTTTSDTDLLILGFVAFANEDIHVSSPVDFDGVDMTEIHATTSSNSSNDCRAWVYGLVSPGAKTANITVEWLLDVNAVCLYCINYKGCVNTSVAAATSFLTEDVNNDPSATSVHASGGSAGNSLLYVGCGKGFDMHPVSPDNSFSILVDDESGGGDSNDTSIAVCEKLNSGASALTVTWSVSDENASAFIELVAAAGGLNVNMGLVSEIDLAQSLGKAKARAIGLTTEADLTQPFVTSKSINIGLVSEAEVSQAFSALKQRAIGILAEANLAQVFSKAKAKAIGLVSETELAQTLAASKALAIGIVTETELAQTIGRAKAKAIGLLSETDQVFAFDTIGLTVNMGLVLETDIVQTLGKTKDKTIGLLTEADLAQAMSSAKSTPLGLITEVDIPFALGTAKLRSIGLIAELDAPLAFAVERGVDIGLLLETDTVFAMSAARALSLGLVSESDIVFSMSSPSIILVTNLVQRDARFQVKLRRDGLFTETLKRESKFAQSVKRDAKF